MALELHWALQSFPCSFQAHLLLLSVLLVRLGEMRKHKNNAFAGNKISGALLWNGRQDNVHGSPLVASRWMTASFKLYYHVWNAEENYSTKRYLRGCCSDRKRAKMFNIDCSQLRPPKNTLNVTGSRFG